KQGELVPPAAPIRFIGPCFPRLLEGRGPVEPGAPGLPRARPAKRQGGAGGMNPFCKKKTNRSKRKLLISKRGAGSNPAPLSCVCCRSGSGSGFFLFAFLCGFFRLHAGRS